MTIRKRAQKSSKAIARTAAQAHSPKTLNPMAVMTLELLPARHNRIKVAQAKAQMIRAIKVTRVAKRAMLLKAAGLIKMRLLLVGIRRMPVQRLRVKACRTATSIFRRSSGPME